MSRSIAYSLQLSDGMLRNGLISSDWLLDSLKVNLLLFDHLLVSAPALLRNHVLFDLLDEKEKSPHDFKNKQGLKRAYEAGIIKPMVFGKKSLSEVVKDVTENKENPVGISDPKRSSNMDLIKHHFEYLHEIGIDDEKIPTSYSKDYYGSLASFLKRLEKLNPGKYEKFLSTLDKVQDVKSFKVADAYELVARLGLSSSEKSHFNQVSFIVREWKSKPEYIQEFSSTGIANHLAKELYLCDFTHQADDNSAEKYGFKIDFPIKMIHSCSLLEIMEFRQHEFFQKMREALQPVRDDPSRNGKSLSDQKKLKFLHYRQEFKKFLSQEFPDMAKAFLKNKEPGGWIFSEKSSFGFAILGCIGKFFEPSPLDYIAIIGAGLNSILARKLEASASSTISFDTSLQPDSEIDLTNGSQSIKPISSDY